MCLWTVASEFKSSPFPNSSNDGEYPSSATKREMKSEDFPLSLGNRSRYFRRI